MSRREHHRPDLVAIVGAALGVSLVAGAQILIWVSRAELAAAGAHAFTTLWHGGGGLALLYFTAGVPLGALLFAVSSARLFNTAASAAWVLMPLLGLQLVYFAYHGIAAFRYTRVPFAAFATCGVLLSVLGCAFVWVWARTRPRLDARARRQADLTLGAGLCFFTSAWQACGLAGPPGFGLYPELVRQDGGVSFLVGQALAVLIFALLGFVLLLLSMRLMGRPGDSLRGQRWH